MRGLGMAFKCLLLLALCAPAWADRGHAHIGVVVGYPWAWPNPPAYYYPPYYPPTVVIEAPPVYVERGGTAAPATQELPYWYFCSAAQAYYPYVRECPGGWQKVSPQPSKQ